MKGRYMTQGEIDRAVQMGRAGVRLREICAEVGFSAETVRTHLRRAGLRFEASGTPWTAAQIEELRRLAALKLSVAEIAAALGRPESGVRAKAGVIGVVVGNPYTADDEQPRALPDLSALYRGRSYKRRPTASRAAAEAYDLDNLSLAPIDPVGRELNARVV